MAGPMNRSRNTRKGSQTISQKLKDSDTKETDKLNVDAKELSDEKKFDPMRNAQKDTYELINMVDSLKNTMETLAPVLSQGKEIMNMFENFKM